MMIRCCILETRVGFFGFCAKMSVNLEIRDKISDFLSSGRCSQYTLLSLRFIFLHGDPYSLFPVLNFDMTDLIMNLFHRPSGQS